MAKALFALVILAMIAKRSWPSLDPKRNPELWERTFQPEWLILCGVFYIIGLAFSAAYWCRLLHLLQQPWPMLPALRAYYVGHLGKYLPGKAWALVMRSGMARAFGVRISLAVLTSFYEVLVTMAAGVALALVVFGCYVSFSTPIDGQMLLDILRGNAKQGEAIDPKLLVLIGLILFGLTGMPIMPPIFNRVVHRLSLPFRDADTVPPPKLTWQHYLEGLIIVAVGWMFLGLSLWALMQTVSSVPPAWSFELWMRYSAIVGLAYVAGFAAVFVPGGLGVREASLLLLLVPEFVRLLPGQENLAQGEASLAVLLLRLIWTAAELAAVGILYLVPRGWMRS